MGRFKRWPAGPWKKRRASQFHLWLVRQASWYFHTGSRKKNVSDVLWSGSVCHVWCCIFIFHLTCLSLIIDSGSRKIFIVIYIYALCSYNDGSRTYTFCTRRHLSRLCMWFPFSSFDQEPTESGRDYWYIRADSNSEVLTAVTPEWRVSKTGELNFAIRGVRVTSRVDASCD